MYQPVADKQRQAVIAESQRISAELKRHPEQIITHTELKRRLAAKKAKHGELVIKPLD